MIRAYIGRIGQGKTLSMVYDGIQALREGRRVFTNTPFYTEIPQYKTIFHRFFNKHVEYKKIMPMYIQEQQKFLNCFMTETNALFLIDESGVIFNNRTWSIIPRETIYKFLQSRKYGIDIFFTTQRLNITEKTLRENCHEVVKCEFIKRLPIFGGLKIENKCYDPELFDFKYHSPTLSERFLIWDRVIDGETLKKMFKRFDTTHIV